MRYLLMPLLCAAFLATCQPVIGQIEKPEVPKEIQKEFDRYIGTWELKGSFGDTPMQGTVRARWSMNRRHLTVRVAFQEDDGVRNLTQLMGWDPVAEEIVSFHFALGGPVIGRNKVTKPGVWEGGSEVIVDGKRAKSRSKTVFEGDRIVFSSTGEGMPDESYEFRRLPAKPAAIKQK